MKDRINRLARGIADFDIPTLTLLPEAFDAAATAGELAQGAFTISAENHLQLKGLVYSDHPSVRVLKAAFGGIRTRITFEIDARNLKDGDQIDGHFYLVSNAGERTLPYSFCVRAYASAAVIAKLRTAKDFARLFVDEEASALRVFDYDDFCRAPFMQDARTRTIYEGLRPSGDRRQALLSFLAALGADPQAQTSKPEAKAEATGESQTPQSAALETPQAESAAPASGGLRHGRRSRSAERAMQRAERAAAKMAENGKDSAQGQAEAPFDVSAALAKMQVQDIDESSAEAGKDKESASVRAFDGLSAPAEEEQSLHFSELEDAVLIEETAGLYIRENRIDREAFEVYAKAVANEAKVIKLYEYYLYALPDDFQGKMPREIYLYFSYGNSIRPDAKLPLYCNILQNFSEDSDIYRKFIREIQAYTIDNLLAANINDKLAILYERMLYAGMIDAHVAAVLPAILKAHRIETADKRQTAVIVRYEELRGEQRYPLKNGATYVPLFLENAVLLFQDAYGNRYADVPYTSTPVLEREELEQRCFEIVPEQPMLKLAAVRKIAERGIAQQKELHMVEEILLQAALSEPYQLRLSRAVLRYYDGLKEEAEGVLDDKGLACLKRIAPERLAKTDMPMYLRVMVKLEQYEEAWRAAACQGALDAEQRTLEALVLHVIRARGRMDDPLLLSLALHLFLRGSEHRLLLAYLCRYYNGQSRMMLRILRRASERVADTADLAERLLAQLIFVREEQGLDEVYGIYVRQARKDKVLINAYLTQKCMDWLLDERVVSGEVFAQLEQLIGAEKQLEHVPELYLLALARYYAEHKSLSAQQQALLARIMPLLLSEKLVFAWTRKLARFVKLPDDVMDKTCIEYHGDRNERPQLWVRILPHETDFHEEEMQRVYQNIYVRQLVLFAGERAEYRICENGAPLEKAAAEGKLNAVASEHMAKGGTWALLNELSALLGGKDETALKEGMLRYVRMQAITDVLFAAPPEDDGKEAEQ